MRGFLPLLLAAALAACGETQASNEPRHAAADVLVGQYNAASNTAREATGAVSIERGGLLFAKGVVLYTRTLNPRSGLERIARDGDSYAVDRHAPHRSHHRTPPRHRTGSHRQRPRPLRRHGPRLRRARLRRTRHHGHAACVRRRRTAGPATRRKAACAHASRYAAPDGARTSEGVVLCDQSGLPIGLIGSPSS